MRVAFMGKGSVIGLLNIQDLYGLETSGHPDQANMQKM